MFDIVVLAIFSISAVLFILFFPVGYRARDSKAAPGNVQQLLDKKRDQMLVALKKHQSLRLDRKYAKSGPENPLSNNLLEPLAKK